MEYGGLHLFILLSWVVMVLLLVSEKDCWSASKHPNWINWYNWHMGTTRRRPSSVWIFVSSMQPYQILNFCVWEWFLWFCVVLAQFGDYSPCFNDHNYLVKERIGYVIHRVRICVILYDICISACSCLMTCILTGLFMYETSS